MLFERKDWPPGPWTDEPDRRSWISEVGLPCEMFRNRYGAWCGYVGIPPRHALLSMDEECELNLCAHGGRPTFVGSSNELVAMYECEITSTAWPGYEWSGFWCSESADLTPYVATEFKIARGRVYRDVAYVVRECERLAAQIDITAVLTDAGIGGPAHVRGPVWSAPDWAIRIASDFSKSRAERVEFLAKLVRDPVAAKLAETMGVAR